MKKYDVIIAGAGISGLSLAHYCAKAGLKTLVIEKGARTGGCLASHRFPSGFWLELGAHTCYNSYENFIGIADDLGLATLRRENVPFRLLVGNDVRSIPFALNFRELLCSAPRIFREKKAGQTVESYYSRIVGPGNYRKVLGPVLSAVPSQRVDDFPAGMLFKKRTRRKDVLKKFTFDGGLQRLTDMISRESGIEVLTGIGAKTVEFSDGLFNLTTEDGGSFQSRFFAPAVPPPAAAGILKAAFPELSAKLALINAVSVESLGVTVSRDKVSVKPFAGLIPLKDSFFSIVSRDTVMDENYRGFSFHFRPGTSYDAKLNRIKEVLRTDPEDIAENNVQLPSPTLGHERLIGEMDKFLDGKRLLLTGNYFSGLAIEDCVTRSLAEFNRMRNLL